MGFLQYAFQRFLSYLLVLFIGITITFFLPRLMPGDPINNYIGQIQARAGQTLTPEVAEQLRSSLEELYGLKGNLLTQYVGFLSRVILHFDFGPSFTSYPEPAANIIFAALPWTVGLLVTTTLLSWLLGNMVGLVAGYFNKHPAATALEIFGIVLYPIPYYILALTVILAVRVFPAPLSSIADISAWSAVVAESTA